MKPIPFHKRDSKGKLHLDAQARELMRDYVHYASSTRISMEEMAEIDDTTLCDFFFSFAETSSVYEERILFLVDQFRRVADGSGV